MNLPSIAQAMKSTWFIRHFIYKALFRGISGVGYIGSPIYAIGLSKLTVDSGFGLYPGARIEILGGGSVEIGRNVRIGHNFFLEASGKIQIGDHVTISSDVFVGTSKYDIDCDENSSFLSASHKSLPVTISKNCFLGKGAVVLPGTTLGKGVIVGANAVVKGNIPAGSIVATPVGQIIKNRFN